MPRNGRSTPSKSKGGWSNGLRFVASLFFLYVLFGGSSAGSGWWSPWVVSGAGSLWQPILLSIAVLSAVALFFGSISSMIWGMRTPWGFKLIAMCAFALVALTAYVSSVFWLVILAFLLGMVAEGFDMMQK